METTNRKIMLPFGGSQRLAEALGVSQPTIRKALRFEENTGNADEVSLARKIRYNAVKHFGGVDTGAADVNVKGDGWARDTCRPRRTSATTTLQKDVAHT